MSRSSSTFAAPPGFRDSPTPGVALGEVVASTYAIQRELVRDETGIVFEARDMLMDRPIAFKLAWRDPGSPSLLAEARRCAVVRDPCAVAIHGMGIHHSTEYVVAERVTGRLLRDVLATPQTTEEFLTRYRRIVAAVARAHDHGVAIGDISGATVLVDPTGRMVLGRLSLSQVPAFGPRGQILAPEIVRGDVEDGDPEAAEAIDLYGLGCIAIEMARGTPPFADRTHEVELRGHAHEAPPRLAALRQDLPEELGDLVASLLEKPPEARPRSVREVLLQVDAIVERLGMTGRSLRVLVVDHDPARGRRTWSLARRAHPSAIVEIAGEGTDAAHKLNRDLPDLVFVEAGLQGVMNALELVMFARGLESDHPIQLVVVGDLAEREQAMFGAIPVLARGDGSHDLATAILDRVRAAATAPVRRRKPRTTITG
ncbi:MAG: hypothetical protein NT062_27460 [Proteobacteria bacterium]|nr:hypothetical protein [Pseudomonadota bacterium]